jgi:hypothetical protein
VNVVPANESNPADIALQLRNMADLIESGKQGAATAIMVTDSGNGVELFGWGLIDRMRCIGLLSLGLAKFTRDTLDWIDAEQANGEQ